MSIISDHTEEGFHIYFKLYPKDIEILTQDNKDEFLSIFSSILNKHFRVMTEVHYVFEYGGYSGSYVLAESHANYHIYTEHGFSTVDIYYCSTEIDVSKVIEDFKIRFYAELKNISIVKR